MSGMAQALVGDWHQALWAAVKALSLFITAAAAFRFAQRRVIAEFTPFDWITAVAVGAIVGRTATSTDTSWLTGTSALLTLIGAHAVVTRMRFSPALRRVVDPPLRVLIKDGEVDERNVRRCGLTAGDLDAILRQHGHTSANTVHLALFEEKGAVSVLAR